MIAGILRTIAIVAVIASGASAAAGEQLRSLSSSPRVSATPSRSSDATNGRHHAHGPKYIAARSSAAREDRYADPAPYKSDRRSSSRGEATLDVPGQTTVLTRQVLDDMNATTLRDALRSTAGVTIGR